jgi:hypothetical protein
MSSSENSGSYQTNPAKKRRQDSKGGFFRWFGRNRRIQVIFLLLVLSVPVFVIVYGIVVPTRNYKPSITTGGAVTETTHKGSVDLTGDQVAQVKRIIDLETEKAYQNSRLYLSDKDSVYFILNIPDSAIILEIKGIPVRINKILEMEISNRFRLINHENLLPWLSEPFTLERDVSTIPKSPIVVKQAPKDTVEAAKISSAPATPDSTDVYYTLYFDRNLVLEIEQSNPLEKGNVEKVIDYKKTKRKEANRSVIETMRNPQQANQPLTIKLILSDSDAKAIYRAIPAQSHLILKL